MTEKKSNRRPLLLVTLVHDYVARDFVDSGVLAELKDAFDLCFITGGTLETDLQVYGPVLWTHKIGKFRSRVEGVGFSLRHLAGLDSTIRTQRNRLDSFMRGRSPLFKKVVLSLHRLKLSSGLSRVFERALTATAPDLIPRTVMPDIALLPTGINDPLWDDVIVSCKRLGIPSLTVTVNWDNIAHKVFLQQPDWLGVWGEQGYLFARLLQKVPAERIVMLGTPRFEPYRNVDISKKEARTRLGLAEDGRVLLFAGAGVPFDEVSIIEDFERACSSGDLPGDVLLLYKPHPKRHARAAEPPLRTESYKRVKLVYQDGLTKLKEYPVLLRAVDALVSPLSTMVLEATLMGLPTLGLAYEDPAHGDFPWENARLNMHLHPVITGRWHIPCLSRADVMSGFKRLLTLIGRDDLANAARNAAAFIVFSDGRSYSERLTESLKLVMKPDGSGTVPPGVPTDGDVPA